MKNIAIILAGGSGERLGGEVPKQFLPIAGRKIIEWTISAFEKNEHIDEIAVVTRSDSMSAVEGLVAQGGFSKVRKIIEGGTTRQKSSLAAIDAFNDDDDNFIFHDAVRPFVTARVIDDCIEALKKFVAVDVAIPASDTVIRCDGDLIAEIPDRACLFNSQTPQCFKRGIIKKAYDLALREGDLNATDDCGVVKKYLPDVPIFVVQGDVFNIKITYKSDLLLAENFWFMCSLT